MKISERRELEQRVLEVMKDYPTTLDSICLRLSKVSFTDIFQAILHLHNNGDICHHKVLGKTAYRRTEKGFRRRWDYHE